MSILLQHQQNQLDLIQRMVQHNHEMLHEIANLLACLVTQEEQNERLRQAGLDFKEKVDSLKAAVDSTKTELPK